MGEKGVRETLFCFELEIMKEQMKAKSASHR